MKIKCHILIRQISQRVTGFYSAVSPISFKFHIMQINTERKERGFRSRTKHFSLLKQVTLTKFPTGGLSTSRQRNENKQGSSTVKRKCRPPTQLPHNSHIFSFFSVNWIQCCFISFHLPCNSHRSDPTYSTNKSNPDSFTEVTFIAHLLCSGHFIYILHKITWGK